MKRTTQIVWCGVFSALIMLATAYLKIPVATGYIHLGDGLIFASATALGYLAIIPAAIGSALADLLAGYPVYIPATFFIKGCMAYIATFLYRRLSGKKRSIISFSIAALFMLTGYFFYELFIYGLGGAIATSLGTAVQGVAGIIIGTVLLPVMKRIKN